MAQRLDSNANVLGSYMFDAFGVRSSTDNSTDPYSGYGARWGYYRDSETGLSLLEHRYYDANTGRFINRDPIDFHDSINIYAYSANNPLTKCDPSGLWPSDPAIRDGLGTVRPSKTIVRHIASESGS